MSILFHICNKSHSFDVDVVRRRFSEIAKHATDTLRHEALNAVDVYATSTSMSLTYTRRRRHWSRHRKTIWEFCQEKDFSATQTVTKSSARRIGSWCNLSEWRKVLWFNIIFFEIIFFYLCRSIARRHKLKCIGNWGITIFFNYDFKNRIVFNHKRTVKTS